MPDPTLPSDSSERVLRRGLRLLGRSIRQEPRMFSVAFTGSAVYALCTVLQATVVGHVTDHTILPALRQGHTTTGALLAAVGLIMLVATVKSVGITTRRWFAGMMQVRLQSRYRRAVTRQYLTLPLRWHGSRPTGELLSIANSDVEAMFWPIAPLPFACGIGVMLIATVVQVVSIDLLLSVVGLTTIPLIYLVNGFYSRIQSPLVTQAQELRGELASVAHESFDGALVVKTLGAEDAEGERFQRQAEQLRDVNIRVGRIRGLFDPIMEMIPTFGVLAVLLVGAHRVDSGAITAGQLVTVAYLFVQIGFPVRAIGWVLGDMPRAVVGRDRVQRVLDTVDEMPPGPQTHEGSGPAALELQGVGVRYADQVVLADLDLTVKRGATVAVVGATGSGKSTLAALLVRLQDPDDGTVLLDGVDVRSLRLGEVARHVAYVPQTTFLFDDTVRGNVDLTGETPDAEVWEALRLAQAEGFVAALPHGLDTLVGERGASLSGGQKQRLALARALVRRPRLLVLDDATSAVDPQVEAAILAGVREASQGTTVVVVAYRRATISLADQVVWIADGRVAAQGTHTRLLKTTRAYRDLVTAYDDAAERRADAGAEAVKARGGRVVGVNP